MGDLTLKENSLRIEPATLSNLAEGELEDRFQTHLKEITGIFADPRPWVQGKDGETKVKITLEVEMVQDSGGMIVVAVHSDLKRPKRKGAIRAIHRRGAEWFVSSTLKQQPLPIAVRAVGNNNPAE